MAKGDNLEDFLADIADAIREKKGSSDAINAQNFADEIRSINTKASTSMWTGHADVEGLKAIGWDDEDIAYYQQYGVNWNEEDDEYHKVPEDNKALYGVVTLDNFSNYANRVVYLPKIDTSGVTNFSNKFQNSSTLIAIPLIDTSNATNFERIFYNCKHLTCIPPLNTKKVTNIRNAFYQCSRLYELPELDFSSVTVGNNAFANSGIYILPKINTSKVQTFSYFLSGCVSLTTILSPIDVSNATSIAELYSNCQSLVHIAKFDSKGLSCVNIFNNCYHLVSVQMQNLSSNLNLATCYCISKESVLFFINNEAAVDEITITLDSHVYSKLSVDVDVVAALANHPLVSLASA